MNGTMNLILRNIIIALRTNAVLFVMSFGRVMVNDATSDVVKQKKNIFLQSHKFGYMSSKVTSKCNVSCFI